MFSQYKFPFHIFVAVSTILFYYLLRRYRTTSATDRTTSATDRTTSATDRTTPKTKFDSKNTTIEKESITTPDTKTNIYLSMYIPVVLYIGFFITNSINCGSGSGSAFENAVEQLLSPGSIMSDLYQSSIIL